MSQFAAPYPAGLIFSSGNPHSVPASFVPGPKHDGTFSAVGYASATPSGPAESYTSYYEHHGPLHSTTVHSGDFTHNQSEAQYMFHDIDTATTYLDGSVYTSAPPPEYVW